MCWWEELIFAGAWGVVVGYLLFDNPTVLGVVGLGAIAAFVRRGLHRLPRGTWN